MCCYILPGLTIHGSKLLLVGAGQDLFVEDLGLLVLPLLEEAGRLERKKEEEEDKPEHISVSDQMGCTGTQ